MPKTKTLGPSFFSCATELVAYELLGKTLCRRLPNGEVRRLLINETEAYVGPDDKACHAYGYRRTKRTEVMYQPAGTIYVYLIYGMYWMLNIVTGVVDYPAAVLIRGAGNLTGPGKLTRDLAITGDLNGLVLSPTTGLWIEEGIKINESDIQVGPRVGIDYAGEWVEAPLRFVLKPRTN